MLKAAGVVNAEVIIPKDIRPIEQTVKDDQCRKQHALSNVKALVVDDSKLMRFKIATLMKETGISEIHYASTGREAIQKALDILPDIITMDIEMPELDGINATKYITGILPKAKVIVISSSGGEDRILRCIKNGARDFILKPINDIRVKRALLNNISEHTSNNWDASSTDESKAASK